MTAAAQKKRLARWSTLIGYFGLLGLLLNWHTWMSPPETVPRVFLIVALVVPLLFPMRGLLHERAYTHAWTSFLSLGYFALGIDVVYTVEVDRVLGGLQIVFSVLLFVGCIYFPRYARLARDSH